MTHVHNLMLLKSAILVAMAASVFFGQMNPMAGAQVLGDGKAERSVGGAVVLSVVGAPPSNEVAKDEDVPSDWWSECRVSGNCLKSAEANNGFSCPAVYFVFKSGGPGACTGTCVISCANNLPSMVCVSMVCVSMVCVFDLFWDCYDDTLINSPGICGAGTIGNCPYTAFWNQGTGWTTCTLAGGCTPNGGTITCGVARTCYQID